MRAKRNRRYLCTALALLIAGHAAAGAESPAITRGRQIYLTGVPADGAALLASVGNPAMDVPAKILRCVNCHRRDGRGKAEGGIVPADIRAQTLAREAAPVAGGRPRTAYTDKLLIRAIAAGLDSSGNPLAPAMPRYRLTHEQAADLAAYLGVLGSEMDPGVTESSIELGVMLPPASVPGSGESIRTLLAAYASRVNEQGGLYGRRLQFAFAVAPEAVEKRAGALRDFVEIEQPFALLASYTVGCEEEIGRYLEEHELPSIGPISLYAEDDAASRRHTFHLLAGLAAQGEALARFHGRLPAARTGALFVRRQGDDEISKIADTLSKRLAAADGHAREVVLGGDNPPDWNALLRGAQPGAIFWLAGPDGFPALYRAAAEAGKYPYLFMPGALAGQEIWSAPPGFRGRIFCAFPALASDQTPAGREEFRQLAAGAGSLPRLALSAAKLLVHGLSAAGKELSREKLVETLEQVNEFASEQTPPVTFNSRRRVGPDGAYVVELDLERKIPVEPPVWVTVR